MKAFSVLKHHYHHSRLLGIQQTHNSLLRKSNLDQERIGDYASPTSARIFRRVQSMTALLQAYTSIEREGSIYDHINCTSDRVHENVSYRLLCYEKHLTLSASTGIAIIARGLLCLLSEITNGKG